MALLAAYCLNKKDGQTLEDYLENEVFADVQSVTLMADDSDIAGFDRFLERYKNAFPVEKAAIEFLQ
ncbi:MAG: hypothetical protein IKI93_11615 [Clostridia bacterium]|nr:hypothetical protein [Clostridia bacterium]